MGIDKDEDLKRKLIELSLSSASAFKSPQTGYVHLNYESEEGHDTIPLIENFSFILALLRSRLVQNILEAKRLLEQLLNFEVSGNFPVYLHEFPSCRERALSLEILPYLHWIIEDFHSVLGEELADQLGALISRILSHINIMHSQRPLSKAAAFRLNSYLQLTSLPNWHPVTSEEWAHALITYQMAIARLVDCPPLLDRSLEKWNAELCVFLDAQTYDRGEPKVTLFDLFMGAYYHIYSQRALQHARSHLLASIIQPFTKPALPSPFNEKNPCHVLTSSALQPYLLYWGSSAQLSSLMFDARKVNCHVEKKGASIEFIVDLPPREFAEGEEVIELAFFMSAKKGTQILINGIKATAFQLGDLIHLVSEKLEMKLTLQLLQGEGRFFGHISHANRPHQRVENLRFDTFDWQIALRTIYRSQECSLKLTLIV